MLRSVGAGGGRLPPATRWMWKRSHGATAKAPPDERGGNRYVLPKATAPHLDSTQPVWVINGPDRPEIQLLLLPRKRTQVGHRAMSGSAKGGSEAAYSITSLA